MANANSDYLYLAIHRTDPNAEVKAYRANDQGDLEEVSMIDCDSCNTDIRFGKNVTTAFWQHSSPVCVWVGNRVVCD
jgi:hypothetical protein